MGEAREGDCRVQLIIVLFFICVVGGGVFLCHVVFLKETDETFDWYCLTGITLEAIPWVCWFLIYIYTCFKNCVIKKHHPPPPPTAAAAATASPTSSPKSDEQLSAHFGLAEVVEEDEGLGIDGGGNEDQSLGDGLNRASSLSELSDVEAGIRKSEMH